MSSCDQYCSLLPSNRQPLEVALEQVLSTKYCSKTPELISAAHNPKTCPSHLLPWLAYAESVDVWSDDWTEERKRTVIEASFYIHRIKGSRRAIELALVALGQSFELVEWWETPGQQPPCTALLRFDADIQRSTGISMRDVLDAVNRTKRLALHISTHMDDQLHAKEGAVAVTAATLSDAQTIAQTDAALLKEAMAAYLYGHCPPQPPAAVQSSCSPTQTVTLFSDNNHAMRRDRRLISVFNRYFIDDQIGRFYRLDQKLLTQPMVMQVSTLIDQSPYCMPTIDSQMAIYGLVKAVGEFISRAPITGSCKINRIIAARINGVMRRPESLVRVFTIKSTTGNDDVA